LASKLIQRQIASDGYTFFVSHSAFKRRRASLAPILLPISSFG